jgi:putative membrane protein
MPSARLLLLLIPVSLGLAQTVVPDDRTFLLNAIQNSRAEVDICRLAISKASHRKIRGYAETMVDNRTRFTAQLEALAKQKGIAVPDKREPIPLPLTQLTGKEFYRNYENITIEHQEKALAAFQNEAQSGTDPDIKRFAAKAIPGLLKDLDQARGLER